MNKKFLSAVLFGAMIATTTSTFVSCKDYDDDIAGLQEQIDGVKSNLTSEVTSLRGELASAKTELQNELNGTKTELANTKTELATAKTDLQNAINSKADATKVSTLEGKVSTLEGNVSTLEGRVSTLETQIKEIETLKGRLNQLTTDMATEDAKNLQAIKDGVAEVKADYKALFKKTLNSLVLNPQLYYGGIEAVQVSTIEYNEKILKEVCADDDHSKDAPTTSKDKTHMSPIFSATYHMNPSSADVEGLAKENFAFKFEDKKYVSRAAITSETIKVDPSNGDLTVTALLTGGLIADGNSDNVTTVALEVTLEDGKIVTSDYAAVYAEKITGFKLENEKVKGCDELYDEAAEAIANPAIAQVAWDKTIDLADYVETHYTTIDEGVKRCTLLSEETLKDYGFSYNYELVGYTEGTNKTSQSAHAALNGSVLRPQLPVDGKAAAWGDEKAKQSPATVGRMPLVRVTLVDDNSDKIVAVGYVKVEITATPGENTIGATAAYTFADKFTLSCVNDLEPMNVKWYQIEETILAQLGISKAEFDANYTYDAGKFFDKATLEAKELTGKAVPAVTVAPTTTNIEGTMTEVLSMDVDANYAYEHFLKATTMSVIVRYYKNTGVDALGNKTYDYVYVTLTWAPSPLNVNPEGTIANEDKIKQYWFADDNNEGGSGYNEIHVNVNVPGTGQAAVATNNFKKDIMETFVDGDITISGIDKVYTDFEDKDLTKTLVFAKTQSTTTLVGTNGKSYEIKVDATNNKLLNAHEIVSGKPVAAGTPIAELVGNTIKYRYNGVAVALLNAAGRDELAKNVTATILVEEKNACGKSLVKLNNNTFDVKFLRPITVAQATMDSFKDGVDVGTTGSKVDLKLNFTDWRNYQFTNDYFTHYGVKNITAHTDKATTNVSGAWAALPNGMELSYTPASTIKLTDMGYLTYKNNNAEVGNFSIKVPVTVTYTWGEIELVIEIQVAKTV